MSEDRGQSVDPLTADQVQVWYTYLDAVDPDEARRRCWSWLSPDEQARHERFRFDRHRHQYLVAHALVREMLARLLGPDPAAWQFRTVANGRPEIAGPLTTERALRFNLSHTEGLVVCAATWEHDLGVDVEHLARRPVSEGLPERYFSPPEVADLRALPAARQPRVFFDYWTLKEAYIKARGLGLALPLDKFSYRLGTPLSISFAPEIDDDPASWQFAQCEPGPEHLISLAVRRGRSPDLAVRFRAHLPGHSVETG